MAELSKNIKNMSNHKICKKLVRGRGTNVCQNYGEKTYRHRYKNLEARFDEYGRLQSR